MVKNAAIRPSWKRGFALLLGVFVALAFMACKNRQPASNISKQVEETVAVPVPKALQKAQTPAEAKANALDFLSKAKWEYDFVYFYSYYQPKFNWPDLPAQRKTRFMLDSLNGAGNVRQAMEMQQFWRMIEPSYVMPQSEFDKANDLDKVMLPSLYCDHYPIDTASYFGILREEAEKGSYALPHILLASLWAEAHGCLVGTEWNALKKLALEQTRVHLGDRPIWTDLQIECAAILLLAKETLPVNFVSSLIEVQNPDGGWPDFAKGNHSDTHATVLALMVMELSK